MAKAKYRKSGNTYIRFKDSYCVKITLGQLGVWAMQFTDIVQHDISIPKDAQVIRKSEYEKALSDFKYIHKQAKQQKGKGLYRTQGDRYYNLYPGWTVEVSNEWMEWTLCVVDMSCNRFDLKRMYKVKKSEYEKALSDFNDIRKMVKP